MLLSAQCIVLRECKGSFLVWEIVKQTLVINTPSEKESQDPSSGMG